MKKKTRQKAQIITLTMFAVFGVGLLLSIVGLSNTVKDIETETIAKTPEAILTSAGVNSGVDISLPVTYFDQRSDACVNMYDNAVRKQLEKRQFGWSNCDYNHFEVEQGMVGYNLGDDYFPKAIGGNLLSNRGLKDMTRWWSSVDGKSKEYSDTLNLKYKVKDTTEFSFANNDFYPLDEVKFSDGDVVNTDGHNHLFTMSLGVPFVALNSGEENFEITADDDTFVFVGDKLIIDMGGIHKATTGKMHIDENGEVYTGIMDEELAYSGITISKGDNSIIRIFHADRDADGSVFRVRFVGMNLNVMKTQVADGSDGVQVAYDPSDPSYVAPLGETQVFRADNTKGYIIITIIEGVLIVAFSVAIVILARSVVKRKVTK